MVTEYKVVYAETLKACADTVREYNKEGWQPQGGICVDSYATQLHNNVIYTTHYQAIIR